MPFDPNQPYQALDNKPPFDPSQPHEVVGDQNSVGSLEALGRGAEQGATAGFGVPINAGIQALLQKYANNQEDPLATLYSQNRAAEQARFEQARAQHPYLTTAGNIGGGAAGLIAGGALLGGGAAAAGVGAEAAGIGASALNAAKLGSLYGAAGGVGQSLSEQDVPTAGQLGSNVLEGSVYGGTGGAVLGGAGKFLEPSIAAAGQKARGALDVLTDIKPFQTVKQMVTGGAEGRNLVGASAKENLSDETKSTIGQVVGAFNDKLNQASQAKNAVLQNADQTLGHVDITDWADHAYNALDNAENFFRDPADLAQIQKMRQLLDSHLGERGTILPPSQVEQLLRDVGQFGTEGDNKLPAGGAGRTLANRLVSPGNIQPGYVPNAKESALGLTGDFVPLKTLLNTQVPGLPEANANISKYMGDDYKSYMDKALTASERNAVDPMSSNINQLRNIQAVIDPDLQQAFGGKINSLIDANKAAATYAEPSLLGGLAPRKMGYAGANVAGMGARALYDMTPPQIQNIAQSVLNTGSPLAKKLGGTMMQAATRDQRGRNALLFAIEQDPQYRDLLRQAKGTGEQDNGQ